MQTVVSPTQEAGEFPFEWEQTFPLTADKLAPAVARMLSAEGYRVDDSDPSHLVGRRDVVLDLRRRLMGKIAIGVAVILTLITLGLFIVGVTNVTLLDWILTVQVLIGGAGLMQLRHPPNWQRRMVDVRFTADADTDSVRVHVFEGVGKVEDDTLFQWLKGETAEVREEIIGELTVPGVAQPAGEEAPE
jgi:hypothetical protein